MVKNIIGLQILCDPFSPWAIMDVQKRQLSLFLGRSRFLTWASFYRPKQNTDLFALAMHLWLLAPDVSIHNSKNCPSILRRFLVGNHHECAQRKLMPFNHNPFSMYSPLPIFHLLIYQSCFPSLSLYCSFTHR